MSSYMKYKYSNRTQNTRNMKKNFKKKSKNTSESQLKIQLFHCKQYRIHEVLS